MVDRVQDFRNATFVEADFTGAQFRGVDLSGVKISDAYLVDVEVSGHVQGVTINGVDVTAYVEQQLDERHPIRTLLRASDPEGLRRAWSAVREMAEATLERARRLPAEKLDESVDHEWSYLQTLRHLSYATDRWISGSVLAEPRSTHPFDLPNPQHDGLPPDVFDIDARPSLEQVLAVRRERVDGVTRFLAAATEEELAREVESPNGGMISVARCIQVVLREEWWHDQYANRDLTILER